ncbi:uncharacterized protein LOC129293102 [Prosopis cineraria]|uniref:uncharacterized protein LOC129293102 n=1 Tax=Prosopis cineraria TaxID=364024 RepID=UPI0024106B9A|nr:uncharacterized protein LOC129293102 [Prosopis cineraria]
MWMVPSHIIISKRLVGVCYVTRRASLYRGFTCMVEGDDSLSTELWACAHGLSLAWDAGIRKVELETSNGCGEDPGDYGIVMEVKALLQRNWEVRRTLVSRRWNGAAEYLAKLGLSQLPGIIFILHAPADLIAIYGKGLGYG